MILSRTQSHSVRRGGQSGKAADTLSLRE